MREKPPQGVGIPVEAEALLTIDNKIFDKNIPQKDLRVMMGRCSLHDWETFQNPSGPSGSEFLSKEGCRWFRQAGGGKVSVGV